jgi:hypothetical protein
MGKYDPLTAFLRRQPAKEVRLSFQDIMDEDKIGIDLPRSAREYRELWANESSPGTRHTQCVAWRRAGWHVKRVDPVREFVIFERD